jgi:myo-inositol-1(or 4)-monophosphatase
MSLELELRELAGEVARRAGTLLLDERPRQLVADTKSSPTDFVTAMDRRSERLIRDLLLGSRPDDGILGEEGTATPSRSGIRWVVDPLDGTVNYFYGRPDFAVSIAAERQGRVVGAAVFDARTRRVYDAALGHGSRLDGVPIACSDKSDLGTALVSTGFSYSAEVRARQAVTLARVLPAVANIRRNGSAALDICSVAEGTSDAYFESDIKEWDVAAGALIATEAGAAVHRVSDGSDPTVVVAAAPIAEAFTALIRRGA